MADEARSHECANRVQPPGLVPICKKNTKKVPPSKALPQPPPHPPSSSLLRHGPRCCYGNASSDLFVQRRRPAPPAGPDASQAQTRGSLRGPAGAGVRPRPLLVRTPARPQVGPTRQWRPPASPRKDGYFSGGRTLSKSDPQKSKSGERKKEKKKKDAVEFF